MNVIIVGAGEIGSHLAEHLSVAGHNATVIESSAAVASQINEKLDVRVIEGNGSSVGTLEEAAVAECDVFFGLSSDDNTNVVAASLAKSLGAKKGIARVHSDVQQEQWLYDYRTHFGIDYLFSSERLAAVDLAKFIRNPDSLVVEEMAGGRIELQQIEVESGSAATTKSIQDLALPARIRIGSIRRGESTIVPTATEILRGGDIITLFGNPRKLQDVLPTFRRPCARREDVRVVIFGGGEYGLALAQMLENGPYRTRIFESSRKRCEVLSRLLHKTTLIHADATSMQLLREEQVGEADFFVGASLDDEDNVMTCLQAHDLGVKHCVTLVHRADYADTITRSGERLGILGAVSPRVATRRDLVRFLTSEKFNLLLALDGDIDVVEFLIRPGSRLIDKSVGAIPWPRGCGLVARTRGSSADVPAAADTFAAGDIIIALVSKESRSALARLIG